MYKLDYKYVVDFGPNSGLNGISYKLNPNNNTGSVAPVRFTIIWNNNQFTSGFVGDSSFDQELISKGFGAVQGGSEGTLLFNKDSASPESGILLIKSLRESTEWEFEVIGTCLIPTPTPTPPLTNTPTLSVTPTNSPTTTPTCTQTPGVTLTLTPTPGLTQTSTPTPTTTSTSTLTPTPTLTPTSTILKSCFPIEFDLQNNLKENSFRSNDLITANGDYGFVCDVVDGHTTKVVRLIKNNGLELDLRCGTCADGQTLNPITNKCDGLSINTPEGINVIINPFPQRGISLGLSVAFQEVTLQGTTTFYEFYSQTNPTIDFAGIQINTSCSFTGDLSITFLLPNDISSEDFEKMSIISLLDNSDLTESRDYTSRTIQGIIPSTQGLSIMSGETKKYAAVVSQTDCPEGKSYCSYYEGFWKGYKSSCQTNCKGTGNSLNPANECKCLCPDGVNACYDNNGRFSNCVPCNKYQAFFPSASSQFGYEACSCHCVNSCGSKTQDEECNCLCTDPSREPCGFKYKQFLFDGKLIPYYEETCCPEGWTCHQTEQQMANRDEGTCCPPGTDFCNGDCCKQGEECVDDTKCCSTGFVIVNNDCCEEDCGGVCCKGTETCVNQECCPEARRCQTLGGLECCPKGKTCDYSTGICVDVGGGFGEVDGHQDGTHYWRWLYGNNCPSGTSQQPNCLDPSYYPNPNWTIYWVSCGDDGVMYPADSGYQIDWDTPVNFPVC